MGVNKYTMPKSNPMDVLVVEQAQHNMHMQVITNLTEIYRAATPEFKDKIEPILYKLILPFNYETNKPEGTN